MASGVMPEYTGLVVAEAAAACGYSDAGVMVRPENWRDDELGAMLDIAHHQGLKFLDVEVLWIPRGGELSAEHKKVVDVGLALGAENILCVSDEKDPGLLAPALRQVSAWCDGGLQPVLEFLRITQVQSLRQASELLDACEGHDFGVLIDSLHLARSGESDAELGDLARFPYVQICDGKLHCAGDYESLLKDAIDGRSAPGEGELPLASLLHRLPRDIPLSVEVRSAAYRQGYPDPIARAQAILDATRKFLADNNLED